MNKFIHTISETRYVIISFALFLVFIIIVLPYESAKSTQFGLINSPDTSLYYTASQLYEYADEYGLEGRAFYDKQRFSFDIIWPLVYSSFLILSVSFFIKKNNLGSRYYLLLYLAFIGMIFDFIENIMTSIVMIRYPSQTPFIASIAGFITLAKWLSLFITFSFLLYLIVLYLIIRIKRKQSI
jgi:hypothetical protein